MARSRSGVERRAVELPGDYRRPLAKLDTKYHGTLANQTGPLVRRLEGFGRLQGLVVGAWQEGSKDLHTLLDILADTKVRKRSRDWLEGCLERILRRPYTSASSGGESAWWQPRPSLLALLAECPKWVSHSDKQPREGNGLRGRKRE